VAEPLDYEKKKEENGQGIGKDPGGRKKKKKGKESYPLPNGGKEKALSTWGRKKGGWLFCLRLGKKGGFARFWSAGGRGSWEFSDPSKGKWGNLCRQKERGTVAVKPRSQRQR